MTYLSYEEVEPILKKNLLNSTVNFQEYGYINPQRKTLLLQLTDCPIINYIEENQLLEREEVARYYGEDAIYENYCLCPYLRIVVDVGDEIQEERILHLNKTYFSIGLQKIQINTNKEEVGNGWQTTDMNNWRMNL